MFAPRVRRSVLLTLAFFCPILFTKTDKAHPTQRKLQRNRIYVASNWMILLCLVLIVLFGWLFDEAAPLHPVLWLESAATLAYGVAWLTKGEAILGDLVTDARADDVSGARKGHEQLADTVTFEVKLDGQP